MELLRGGWRVFRAAPGPMTVVALVPGLSAFLLAAPAVFMSAAMLKGLAGVIGSIDLERFRLDPVGAQLDLQAAMEAAMRPQPALAFLSGVASGASITLGLLGTSMLTVAALDVIDGRRPSLMRSFRTVFSRADGIVAPAIVLGMGWAVIGTPITMREADVAFATGGSSAANGLLGLVGIAFTIAAFVLGVRWALAIPAIVEEDLGLRAGLARSTALTSGVRVPIAIAFIAIGFATAVVLGLTGLVGAIVGYAAVGTVEGGAVGYLIVAVIVGTVISPIAPAMLARAYRLRIGSTADPTVGRAPPVDGAPASGGAPPDMAPPSDPTA